MPDLNPPAEPSDELLELVVRSFDAELTPDESRRLNELLRLDPRNRERYVQYCLHAQMIRKACSADSAAAEEQARPRPKSTRRRRVSGGEGANSWQLALAAAGVLLGIAALTFVFSSPTDDRPPAKAVRWTPLPVEQRAKAEARLQEIERKQNELSKPPAQTEPNRDDEQRRQKELEELKNEKERIEQELRDSVQVVRKPVPAPEKPPVPVPVPSNEKKQETRTQAAIAVLEKSSGDVTFGPKDKRMPAQAGSPIEAGQSILTGSGVATILFPDKTRVELGPDTEVDDLKADGGKRLFVASGWIRAVVSKQPVDQPMLCGTPYGEAKVLGTTLRLVVDTDKAMTRLEVEEGKVQLKNLAGKTVDVPAGHSAVAAVGTELAAKPLPINDILLVASQGKRFGEEWRPVKDDQAAAGSAVEALTVFPRNTVKELQALYGASQARILNRTASFVEFRFTADAGRDYAIWTRGSCLAIGNPIYDSPLYYYDDILMELPTGTPSRSIPIGPNFCIMNGFAVRKGYWWLSGDAWTDKNTTPPAKPQDTVPTVVRFDKAGPQILRIYGPSTVLRIDAIWLSTTQKTRPDDKATGPATAPK